MMSRFLTLLSVLLILIFLSGCGTDTKHTENLSASTGESHYGGLYIDGNDNPANRAQYMGYSLKGMVNVGGTGNGTSPSPLYREVDYTIACLSCHPPTPSQPDGDTTANATILKDYATTGHADVTAIPWTIPEIGGNCQRCHTTFGFLYHLQNYDPSAPFTGITLSSPDLDPQWTGEILSTPLNQREEYRKAMQVLICSACHPEDGLMNGTLRTSALLGGYVANWTANNITALVSFPDAGASNLCIRCHSARRAGPNITDVATTTAHYLPAAATVYSGTTDLVIVNVTPPAIGEKFTGLGYEFTGQNYVFNSAHKSLGTPGGKGPCVACHMSASIGHTLKVVSEDSTGKVSTINSRACEVCHGVLLPTWLNDRKTGLQSVTAELDVLLQSKGFYLNPVNGNFYRDAGFLELLGLGATSAERTASAKKYYDDQAILFSLDNAALRGAVYNLWLFKYKGGDPAVYVHNSHYGKRILFDTLDYLDDGVVNGGVTLDLEAADYLDGDRTIDGIQRP